MDDMNAFCLSPKLRGEVSKLPFDEDEGNSSDMLSNNEVLGNANLEDFVADDVGSGSDEGSVLDKLDRYDTMESPRRIETPNTMLFGFASLRTNTFDNNFKDLEGLKRRDELLTLSKRYLYSKLYTPKLEALKRLVEPRNCFSGGGESTYDVTAQTSEMTEYGYKSSTNDTFLASSIDEVESTDRDNHKIYGDKPFFKGVNDLLKGSTQSPTSTVQNTEYITEEDSTLDIPPSEDKNLSQESTRYENVITLISSDEYVNGLKKRRVSIPRVAYQPLKSDLDSGRDNNRRRKVILKVFSYEKDSENVKMSRGLEYWFAVIENRLDKILGSIELYGAEIVNPSLIINELESIRPPWMDKELFYLLCLKPVGMANDEFIELLRNFNYDSITKRIHNFNLVNINAMGHVLDAENETIRELIRLNRIHRRLVNEEDIYTKIFTNMQKNFKSQAEDLLQATRQDLRLAAGYFYLQWGRIKNILTWNPGEPVMREKGFSQEVASKNKIKTLQRMQEIFGSGPNDHKDDSSAPTSVNEAQYIYYIKSLQDMEDNEQESLQLQITRDRMQALAEYSATKPPIKPKDCFAWKCIGVSCNSIIWKMYNTVECAPIVYKFRPLKDVDKETVESLKVLYANAFETVQNFDFNLPKGRQVLFATGHEIHDECIVESMTFIKHLPLSEFIEKSMQISPSERFSQMQIAIREISNLVYQMKDLDFLLPLKSSRIYVHSGGVALSAGMPLSLLGHGIMGIFDKHSRLTIATLLWGKQLAWYLPPESNGDPAFTRDPILVSKAHTWMIGKILYEAICQGSIKKQDSDHSMIELCENKATKEFLKICLQKNVEDRPTVKEILNSSYMKRIKLNYGTFEPVDVPKVRCAVEILGDIETIVLNKIRRTEKGVADYEQCDKNDIVLCDSSDESLTSLITKEKHK